MICINEYTLQILESMQKNGYNCSQNYKIMGIKVLLIFL